MFSSVTIPTAKGGNIGVRPDFKLASVEFTSPRNDGTGDPALIVSFSNGSSVFRKTFWKPDPSRLIGTEQTYNYTFGVPKSDGTTETITLEKGTVLSKVQATNLANYRFMESLSPILYVYNLTTVQGETWEAFCRNLVIAFDELDESEKQKDILLAIVYNQVNGYAEIRKYGSYIKDVSNASAEEIAACEKELALSPKEATKPQPKNSTSAPSGDGDLPFTL